MLNEILDTQKIQRSNFNVKLEDFDLNHRIRELVSDWNILAGQKNITIHLNPGTGLPPVTGDPSKLKDILDNLVSNAIKYSHPDTSIHIITQNGPGDFVKIVVNDQGLGLTGTDRQKVFNGYQTLSARPTGDETSTGFGLMIVKRLVELMEGSVGVESKGKNKGSSFWFTLKKAV